MKLFDHHIHSSRSDGRVSLEDRAKSVALRPHGVSDHYPWHELKDHDALRRYMDDAAQFLKGRMGPVYGEASRFADPELQRRILEAHIALVREGILEAGIDIV